MRISLYIHIPFCISKCDYCDFFSIPVNGSKSSTLEKNVLKAILEELRIKIELIDAPVIDTIFIGGGTPSIIPADLFNKFLTELSEITSGMISETAEFTTEANIESCSREFLTAAAEGGINRLSLGVQSFRTEILQEIGRACYPEDIFKRVSEIKNDWFGDLSMDIISGITENDISDINTALTFSPDHISVYQLTVEENTKLFKLVESGRRLPPDETLQSKSISLINRLLEKEGYHRYEISNYARKGKKCLHNMKYWEMQSYLGLGPSAVSSIYGELSCYRTSNTRNINKYINSIDNRNNDYQQREQLSTFDFMLEHFIMGGRLCEGINDSIFLQRFKKHPADFIPRTLEQWRQRDLTAPGENLNAALNEEGLLFLDAFLSDVYSELSENK